MKKLLFLICIVLLNVDSFSQKSNDKWQELAEMPTPRFNAGICEYNGEIYVIGGTIGDIGHNATATAAVEVYNPKTNTWTTKSSLSIPRTHPSVCVLNDKIYVIGGSARESSEASSHLPLVEIYDPNTDTWTKKQDMQIPRMNIISIPFRGEIYTIGGQIHDGIANVEVYNPINDTWSSKSKMPTRRGHLVVCEVNGKMYAIGGATHTKPNTKSAVEEYNPETDTWIKRTDMLKGRTSISGCKIGDKIFVIGGSYVPGSELSSAVEVYDTKTDRWKTLPNLPTTRAALNCVSVGNKIYAIGGSEKNWPFKPTGKVEVFELTE